LLLRPRLLASALEIAAKVVFSASLCHNAASRRPAIRAAVAANQSSTSVSSRQQRTAKMAGPEESQMPKLKTKSGAKKRFKITATGKVLYAHRGKRHGMIKRTKKQIRQLRGTAVLFKTDGEKIKKYYLPNS
jgi:large subunit ribosomal protein L35